MKEKLTEVVMIRIDKTTKEELEKIAEQKKWTLSQTAALILEAYIRDEARIIKL